MFGRHNGLYVVAVYAAVLLLLGVSARLAFVYYDQHRKPVTEAAIAAETTPLSPTLAKTNQAVHYDYTAVAEANQRLAALQSNLERTTAQLQEKNKLLNQRNAECRALEVKLDESVAFAMELLATEPSADRDEQTRDVKAKIEGDFSSLRTQLRESQILSDDYAERLDELSLDLMQADLEIASLTERAEREIAALVGERLSIEVAAGDVLVQLGEPAVAPLVLQLQNPQPEVKLWAATVLGKLGLNATAALEPLRTLANASDPRVAAAARRAVTLIEP